MAKARLGRRESRSVEELQRGSVAIQYELGTLAVTHELLHEQRADWNSSPRAQGLSNALLHAFLLAARSLLGFLYSDQPRASDIIAEDYFDDPDQWRRDRLVPEPEMENGELVGLISKRLVHLTWDRIEANKPLWGAFHISWNIGKAMNSFLELVDDSKVHPVLLKDVSLFNSQLDAELVRLGDFREMMSPTKAMMEFDEFEYWQRSSRAEKRRIS